MNSATYWLSSQLCKQHKLNSTKQNNIKHIDGLPEKQMLI